jgi:hypothetical protein
MTIFKEPVKTDHRDSYIQLRGLIDLMLYLPANLTWAEIGCYDGASAGLRF